jgi:hypothetical protein
MADFRLRAPFLFPPSKGLWQINPRTPEELPTESASAGKLTDLSPETLHGGESIAISACLSETHAL